MRDRFGRRLVGKLSLYDPIGHVNTMKQRPDLRLFVGSDRNAIEHLWACHFWFVMGISSLPTKLTSQRSW